MEQPERVHLRDLVRQRVRELRQERGMSAQNLADAMTRDGVPTTRSALANYESGRRDDLTFEEAVAIALVFHVDLVDLLGDEDVSPAIGVIQLQLSARRTRAMEELVRTTRLFAETVERLTKEED